MKSQEYKTLYRPQFEHDNCGIGVIVDIKGRQSYTTVDNTLKIVENLEHRAGKDAEGKTGDGVGFCFRSLTVSSMRAMAEQGVEIGGEREYGIGMFFFPQTEMKCNQAKKMFEVVVEQEGMEFLGWREVPVDDSVLAARRWRRNPGSGRAS